MRQRDKDHVAWGSQPQNQASIAAANQGDIDCEMWLQKESGDTKKENRSRRIKGKAEEDEENMEECN